MTESTYDRSTALLVVDVQNDFADPGGSLYVKGAEDILDRVNAEVRAARDQGALVVYTQDWHPPVTPHFQKDGGIWPVHCVGDTWGSELHPSLLVAEGATFVRKGVGGEDGYSAFSARHPATGDRKETGLEDILRERGIERVVVAGLATDYCVKETAMEAVQKGFSASVLTEAIRAVDLKPGDGDRALDDVRAAGAVLV